MYKTLALVFPVKLKEGYEPYLYKNPSRNMDIYQAKMLRFESTGFASVMIDDVLSVIIGTEQDISNSTDKALELTLELSCTKPTT